MTAPDTPQVPPRPARDIISSLADLFPEAFTTYRWRPHQPLKLKIHLDLIATGCLPRSEVRSALRAHTTRRMYLTSLARGGPRFDLNGKDAGEVTPAEATWAQGEINRIDAAASAPQQSQDKPHRQAHDSARANAVKRKARCERAQPSTSVHRHSIADLRSAAAARRAGRTAAVDAAHEQRPEMSVSMGVRRAASGGP